MTLSRDPGSIREHQTQSLSLSFFFTIIVVSNSSRLRRACARRVRWIFLIQVALLYISFLFNIKFYISWLDGWRVDIKNGIMMGLGCESLGI